MAFLRLMLNCLNIKDNLFTTSQKSDNKISKMILIINSPDIDKSVIVRDFGIQGQQFGERPPHKTDERPRVGGGELAVSDVGHVHVLQRRFVRFVHCGSSESDDTQEG